MKQSFDAIIVGAGQAGPSLAWSLPGIEFRSNHRTP
jgi:flavin-dependent dehydrogenase